MGMRKYILTLLILCVCLSLCGCAGEQETTPNIAPTQTATPSAPETSATPEVTTTPETQTGYGAGERVELKDLAVTLTQVEESAGTQFFAPEEGKTFLLCHFDIENNSEEDLTVSSILSFKAYVDDYSVSQSLSATLSCDAGQLDGTVAAGKKMAGAIGYEVDTDWRALEITFNPNIWSGKGITFIAQHP